MYMTHSYVVVYTYVHVYVTGFGKICIVYNPILSITRSYKITENGAKSWIFRIGVCTTLESCIYICFS